MEKDVRTLEEQAIRDHVRKGYARAVQRGSCCCGSGNASEMSECVGYDVKELSMLPAGANLGLGCGNPVSLAEMEEGMTVLDLGSGAGIDCFLAAQRVGPTGRVIGVDMTPEMLERARQNAREGGYGNVEFRQGIIEELPVEDATVDVIVSNCVINLSPEKGRVFAEAFRVLKPGGRIMISDIVLMGELPEEVKRSVYEYVSCVAGAEQRDVYLRLIREAGFEDVEVLKEDHYPGYPVVRSVQVRAVKPEDP